MGRRVLGFWSLGFRVEGINSSGRSGRIEVVHIPSLNPEP